jgi:hypothetical protein
MRPADRPRRGAGHIHDHAVQLGQAAQRQRRQVRLVGVTVERAADIGAGVAAQGDLPDRELDTQCVLAGRQLRAHRVGHDPRHRQPRDGDHSLLDRVAEVRPVQRRAGSARDGSSSVGPEPAMSIRNPSPRRLPPLGKVISKSSSARYCAAGSLTPALLVIRRPAPGRRRPRTG